jgi:ABC-2 type transport system permease protein
MSKISLIIQREYLIRVRKKSFLIMTIIGPILFAAIMVLPAWLATRDSTENRVMVLDRSGLFADKFQSSKSIVFQNVKGDETSQKKQVLEGEEHNLLLVIGEVSGQKLPDIRLFGQSNPPLEVISVVEKQINGELKKIRLKSSGIDPALVESINPEVEVRTSVLSEEGEKDGGSLAATIVGYGAGFLIYMFIFLYGSQIMMSVMEEKTSRVVEILVSSVKPFELMLGKIVGVALVGLTQFLLWVVLSFAVSTAAGKLFLDKSKIQTETQSSTGKPDIEAKAESKGLAMISELKNVDILKLSLCFIVYFLGGYLLYSALFAAVGSAVESQQEAQQFMMPVTIPIILSIVLAQFVIKDPHGSLAFWLSVLPLTSPVIMMVRVPFEPPVWQIILSMLMLVAGFLGTTWLAGKVFRVGILMYGKKVTWTEIAKWLKNG